MNKYLKKYQKEFKLTHSRKEALFKWIEKLENNELKDEVSNYGHFSRLILEKVLGYDYEENIIENVKEDYGRGLSEFALKKDNKKFMVIELKGSDADLDKPQNRKNDKRTPVDQAFDYAKRSGDINWIFVSNYNEFRLYNWHKKQHQYISFKAEDLKDPETFKQFMLVFSNFSTIENNLIDKLVSKTIFVERDLEDEFYKLYNETRLMLIAEIEYLKPEFTREQSVHYSQLILNRYIFICFAEDLGLLPEEISVESIENPVKNNNLGRTEIWHRLNSLFIDVNEGNDFKKIYGYNGGLFSEDIEFLKIRDIVDDHSIFSDAYQKWKFEEYSLLVEEKLSPYSAKINPIYKNLMTISTFNFSSEVDVNILGHIFENSIGDIEELKADTKGRRKKDGIFYTPEHITDYICRNTIIPYLSKSGNINTVKKLISEYSGSEIEELDKKVKKIKIIDPACGSGAFLNKAGDVLLEIHEAIRKYKYKDDNTLMPFFDSIEERRKILLNNIYGVDLNEESVEITKLSLFLKVCKEGLKLPNLDNNIKCGNSLINDPEYTDKPFNWEEEFKAIFDNGGFDVVIGNPPYVRHQRIVDSKKYLKLLYTTYDGRADLYVYFFEKGINILNDGGVLSFICSDKFTKTGYGKNLRKFLLKYQILSYNDYTNKNVFLDASVDPCVTTIRKIRASEDFKINIDDNYTLPLSYLTENSWVFEDPQILKVKEKIENAGVPLKNLISDIKKGILTGYNKAFIIDKQTRDELISKDPASIDVIKPMLRGKDIKRWFIDYNDIYLLYIPKGFPIDDYPSIKEHLIKFKKYLKARTEVINGKMEWFELRRFAPDYYYEFELPKIIYTEISTSLFATYNEDRYFMNNKGFMITSSKVNLKYLSCLISSKALNFVFKLSSCSLNKKTFVLLRKDIEILPIAESNENYQVILSQKADKMLQMNKNLFNEVNGFKYWLKRTYKIVNFSKNLDKYYKLSFDEFLDELKLHKVNAKQRNTQELLKKEFEESLIKLNPLIHEIEKTDNEIDLMVYELYGLNDEEIQIIENSLNN
jgi:hypothetical protein